jgi:glycogen debranching enzyme
VRVCARRVPRIFRSPNPGDAAVVQQVEAVLLLSSGRVPKLLENDADLAPELKTALDGLAAEFRRKLNSGDTKLIQGIDYAPLYTRAAVALGG